MLDGNIEVGQVVTLEEEGGEEMDFRIMYAFEIEDNTYLCLVPVEQEQQDEYEVHMLKLAGEDMLEPIQDEQEWEQVQETFETLVAESGAGDQG